MNAVGICSEAAGTTLFPRFVGDRGRTGCTFMALRYSSMGEKSTFASAGCRGLQMICCDPFPKWKEKLSCSTWNIESVVLLRQIRYRSYWSSLKTPMLSIWVGSFKCFAVISAWHKHGFKVLGYCGSWSLLWASREWKNKGMLLA